MRRALFSLFLALPLLAGDPPPKPRVVFTTSVGAFTLELEPEAAPKTVANFLAYVHSGFYKGTTFHRVIPTFMVQGGAFTTDMKEKTGNPPIPNEAKAAMDAGLHNLRGTIAMARTSAPNSATSQFFINVVDNQKLDPPSFDGWGYCVFGRVVEGMDTVDKIRDVPTHSIRVQHPQAGMIPMSDVPESPVVITDARELKAAAPAPVRKAHRKKKAETR